MALAQWGVAVVVAYLPLISEDGNASTRLIERGLDLGSLCLSLAGRVLASQCSRLVDILQQRLEAIALEVCRIGVGRRDGTGLACHVAEGMCEVFERGEQLHEQENIEWDTRQYHNHNDQPKLQLARA